MQRALPFDEMEVDYNGDEEALAFKSFMDNTEAEAHANTILAADFEQPNRGENRAAWTAVLLPAQTGAGTRGWYQHRPAAHTEVGGAGAPQRECAGRPRIEGGRRPRKGRTTSALPTGELNNWALKPVGATSNYRVVGLPGTRTPRRWRATGRRRSAPHSSYIVVKRIVEVCPVQKSREIHNKVQRQPHRKTDDGAGIRARPAREVYVAEENKAEWVLGYCGRALRRRQEMLDLSGKHRRGAGEQKMAGSHVVTVADTAWRLGLQGGAVVWDSLDPEDRDSHAQAGAGRRLPARRGDAMPAHHDRRRRGRTCLSGLSTQHEKGPHQAGDIGSKPRQEEGQSVARARARTTEDLNANQANQTFNLKRRCQACQKPASREGEEENQGDAGDSQETTKAIAVQQDVLSHFPAGALDVQAEEVTNRAMRALWEVNLERPRSTLWRSSCRGSPMTSSN